MEIRKESFTPVFIHNFSNYDVHIIIKEFIY